MSLAIRADRLSKRYLIPRARVRHDTMRDAIAAGAAALFRRSEGDAGEDIVWALRDASFEIGSGESIGLVGRNGAGKSTLLKVLSRITRPTSGRAEIFGRIGSLLEVGTGFDRELSGRENVYLSGAILGMKHAEIDESFDQIVAFAEVEKFIDTPVKRYSSGMYLRLAFAVAAHLKPEILLLDEVLAVGDAAFQKRCLGKMAEIADEGRTIVFVSHNMAAITRFCTRCLWIDAGRVRLDGPTEDVIAAYLAAGVAQAGEAVFDDDDTAPGSEFVRLLAVRIKDNAGHVNTAIDARHPFTVECEYRVLRRAAGLRIGLTILTTEGVALVSSTDADSAGDEVVRTPGRYVSRCTVPGEFLNFGQYFISVGADFPLVQTHFHRDRLLSFVVERTGGVGSHVDDARSGLLRMRLPWDITSV
jgi:lipopolysaccharide transport system ATP-binding protein